MQAGFSYRNIQNSFNTYFTGGLALFYIGMTFGYACKYAKVKKLEIGE